ncbi:MAG: sugar ABC transporter ATP-binding protein [Spirochaetaceae bacterium]|nr:MAG: sugar ABC transporter ATP-binding protein [Spirochaetaceae bacterium]
MKSISKSFPGVQALDQVDFDLKPGQVHGLVGENGAGKSTLIKILMGAYKADAGQILLDGEEVEIRNPIEAKRLKLGAVYQDITLASELSVGENFFLGKLPRSLSGLVKWAKVHGETQTFLDELGIQVSSRSLVRRLSPAQQEMVTIAKIVYEGSRVVVFDEPTALLANEETEQLFGIIRRLRDAGTGIVYISHRLEEIFEICDTVTVLKDGQRVVTCPVGEIDSDTLVNRMVGRNLEDMFVRQTYQTAEDQVLLEVSALTRQPVFENISFKVHRGEVFGLFGLVGSGRTEIVRSLFGAEKPDTGSVSVEGTAVRITTPAAGIRHGIGLVPENRKEAGLATGLAVDFNINLASYDNISRLGFINGPAERRRADKYVKELRIKTPTVRQTVNKLSGGNQQKVVISKWLCRQSKVFIFDEPTTGVDVGAKVEIYRLLDELLQRGAAIVFISSYLPEIMGIADRILVIREGRSMGLVERPQFSEERLLRLASGLEAEAQTANSTA